MVLTSPAIWRNVIFPKGEPNWHMKCMAKAARMYAGQSVRSSHLDGVGVVQSGLTLTGNDL